MSRPLTAALVALIALASRGYADQPGAGKEGHVKGADGVSLFHRMAGTSLEGSCITE